MSTNEFSQAKVLSFDCYGTLVDWETGILEALSGWFENYSSVSRIDVLKSFAKWEAQVEAGPFKNYFSVLVEVARLICQEFNIQTDRYEVLAESVSEWPPFSDSQEALSTLQSRYQLAILSNVDQSMFEKTEQLLNIRFDHVFTAEKIGSYKPDLDNFHYLLERIDARPDQLVHVAQSIFHDHVPAQQLGLTTVWVDRPSLVPGQGATLPASTRPSHSVKSMAELVSLMGL